MTINLFDDQSWLSLRPLTFTRPVADLRIGVLTIAEKWGKYLQADYGFVTQPYLSTKYPRKQGNLYVNGAVCPDEALVSAIADLKPDQILVKDGLTIAYVTEAIDLTHLSALTNFKQVNYLESFIHLQYPEDIFKYNHEELVKDFALLTKGRNSAKLSATNTVLGENIFIEEGVEAECTTFNTLDGPIYLAKNSKVLEGNHIRGSFSLGEGSIVKMGARIYGGTTVGPYSTVCGEVKNAVIWGYSSKGHEGYLGDSVMGQWCNIGADSNNSNLKNNYAEVRLWDYGQERFRKTGLQFCGLIMGDHSKCGINTMFNTGTVAGVSANIFGAGFPRNFIPDFAWGGAQGFEVYALNKMIETAVKVFERKKKVFDTVEQDILTHVFEETAQYRVF